ncbi:hypothetical protein HWV62_28032 [Athelia sp. TMB]|nr:hypothetical protein HWV62_25952 [Athelia sp. TMB]KAF7982470.1 hypothetical protein HWV62_28032 [Athelia sp. TMB]
MSTDEQHLPKRKRTDDPAGQVPAPVEPVRSDIWYEDGNVVLQAGGMQFKVFRGVLAECSSVFKDMFTFPQPSAADTEQVEGCPVIHLSDSAQEVKIVLQAICQRKYVNNGGKLPLDVIAAFLSLGRKYDIQKLRAEAQIKLYQQFPLTLEEKDKLPTDTFISIDMLANHYMKLAVIARKEGILSILPDLLYRCCEIYSVEHFIHGIIVDDSTYRLVAKDQIACLSAERAISVAQSLTTWKWAYSDDERCFRPEQCIPARQKILQQLLPVPEIEALVLWPLERTAELCLFCRAGARVIHESGRTRFWEQLPDIFGLPPWGELEKEREDIE